MRSKIALILAGAALGVVVSLVVGRVLGPKEGAGESSNSEPVATRPLERAEVAGLDPESEHRVAGEMAFVEPVAVTPSTEPDFQAIMGKVFSGEASDDEELAFWKWLRESDEVDDFIKQGEGATPVDSDDVRAHMKLANLYVAKIYSVPSGPETGLWAMKAEQRWRAVLELDPTHWEAQNSVAFSLSQYPDFLNKGGESIKEYEKLVAIQEAVDPQPRHAETYLALYRLYQKRGDPGNAVDALNQGLERFPNDQALVEQRASVSTLTIP